MDGLEGITFDRVYICNLVPSPEGRVVVDGARYKDIWPKLPENALFQLRSKMIASGIGAIIQAQYKTGRDPSKVVSISADHPSFYCGEEDDKIIKPFGEPARFNVFTVAYE